MPSTTISIAANPKQQQQPPQHRHRACFSFAAYAKSLVTSLKSTSTGIAIFPGLTDAEFAAIETTHGFSFPPDLRSILREGLPSSFPNWRSSSSAHIASLLSYPVNSILSAISRGDGNAFAWPRSAFGPPPDDRGERVAKARRALEKAPVLVPVFGNYYIPSTSSSSSPIFYVWGGIVRCAAHDLMDLFKGLVPEPAWAAREARRVEVWTELLQANGGGVEEEEEEGVDTWGEIRTWLREGGWREEEVREVMMDDGDHVWGFDRTVSRDRESVMWHVRVLAMVLLRAGWSREDVVYCMGSTAKEEVDEVVWQVGPTMGEKTAPMDASAGPGGALVDPNCWEL